jgi:hypothetical protein
MNRPLIGYLLAPTVSAAICLLVSVCTPIFALLLLDEEVQSGSANANQVEKPRRYVRRG